MLATPSHRRPFSPPPGYRFELSPFPTGWYAVALSEELGAGAVQTLRCFGRELVAFRGEDGVAHVLDAHCPHLGAHLGHGGCVRGGPDRAGGGLRCPFHGWVFDGAGQCTDIPYAKKIPAGARVGAWTTREVNGHLFVWFDEAGRAPSFELPVIEATSSPGWVRQERRSWVVKGHIQDLAENGVDAAHFGVIHGFEELPAMEPATDGPVLHVRSAIRYPASMGGAEGTLHTTNHGLGFNATRFTGFVETQLIFAATPIDHETVIMRVTPYLRDLGDPEIMETVGRFFVAEVANQIEADVPIWEHKVTPLRPVLCDGDGPIGAFRRWTRQFYPAGSLGGPSADTTTDRDHDRDRDLPPSHTERT